MILPGLRDEYALIVLLSLGFSLLAFATLCWLVWRRWRKAKTRARWNVFLSHTQQHGDGKVIALDLFNTLRAKGLKVWLDVEMIKQDEEAMKEGVENSDCVLAIITGGDVLDKRYFERRMCLEELKWAISESLKTAEEVAAKQVSAEEVLAAAKKAEKQASAEKVLAVEAAKKAEEAAVMQVGGTTNAVP